MNGREDANGERRLADMMAALRREESSAETPGRVEDAIMRAWNTADRPTAAPASLVGATSRWPAALAAGVLLAVALSRLGLELQQAGVTPPEVNATTLLLVGEPILEGEPVRVVRMRMPVSALLDLGVRSTTNLTGDVDVDLIVGEDGVARAVRF